MAVEKQVTIRNEQDLVQLAESVLSNGEAAPEKLLCSGWPKVHVRVTGERYRSSLPSAMLQGLLDFQDELNRAYASVKYGTANLQRLTNEDKENLELIFTITEGSTDTEGNGDDWLSRIWDKIGVILEGMSGTQKVALFIVIALAVSGYYAFDSYSDNASEVATAVEHTKQLKTVAEATSVANDKLFQIAQLALSQSGDKGESVIHHVEAGYTKVVRSVQDADSMEVGHKHLDSEAIQEIARQDEVVKNKKEAEGYFYIEGIKKNTAQGYMIVNVTAVDSDLSFTIKVDFSFTTEKELGQIYDALKQGSPLRITYQAVLQDGEIVRGRLTNVVENTVVDSRRTKPVPRRGGAGIDS